MTRGNQRELARERNEKKNAGKSKNNESATAFVKRKENDANVMREKQRLADEKKAAAAAGGTAVVDKAKTKT